MSARLLTRPLRRLLPPQMPIRAAHHVLPASRAFSRCTPCYHWPENKVRPVVKYEFSDLGHDNRVALLTKNPTEASKDDFLYQLRALRLGSQSHKIVSQSSKPTIVILTTPTFVTGASWLDDEKFMSQVISSIITDYKFDEPTKIHKISVVAAVVDRLPSHWRTGERNHYDVGAEGFAIMFNYENTITPELWEIVGESAPHAALTFSLEAGTRGIKESIANMGRVRIPLANTLFCNGKPSTLYVEAWESFKSDKEDPLRHHGWTRVDRKEKAEQLICLPNIARSTYINIPAFPLTPWREIVSGLGNIVRQLDVSEKEDVLATTEPTIVPASQELEATVNEYFEVTGQPPRTVQVWAIISSKNQLKEQDDESVQAMNKRSIQTAWTNENNRLYSMHYINWVILNGARIYRVLSGGGGWGIKQGLLALDPELEFGNATNARYDFDQSISAEDDQRKALGDIAKPGDFIRFFMAVDPPLKEGSFNSPKEDSPRPIGENTLVDFDIGAENVVGCIPSSIDDVPVQSEHKPSADFILNPSLFGALTEHGMYFSKHDLRESRETGERKIQVSKIDVPYSKFVQKPEMDRNTQQEGVVENGENESLGTTWRKQR